MGVNSQNSQGEGKEEALEESHFEAEVSTSP